MSDYLGKLPATDPLYDFLSFQVLAGVLGFRHARPVFDVYALDGSRTVFRYSDRTTFVDLVGKFFGRKWLRGTQTGHAALRAKYLRREFENLQRLRALGFDDSPHSVVRPLAMEERLNCVLIESFVHGDDLDFHIRDAIRSGRPHQLRARLAEVSWFLADLHNRTETHASLDAEEAVAFLRRIAADLDRWSVTSAEEHKLLNRYAEVWAGRGVLARGQQVTIHGEPIAPHFLFRREHDLTVIDLERVWTGDRAKDLGCLCAELKHLFFLYCGDPWDSEPFIQHVYREYDQRRTSRTDPFESLTTRGRFYMGSFLLRICRNDWLDLAYRRRLVPIAIECLRP